MGIGDKYRMEHILSDQCDSGIIANIRHIEVSGLESPYMLANIHFSGECELGCTGCHSKALFKVLEKDRLGMHTVLDMLESMRTLGVIQGICVMGTDNASKEAPVRRLLRYADDNNIISIIFTGLTLESAIPRYGFPSFYVTGPYVSGTWDQNKTFFRIVPGRQYIKISKDVYYDPYLLLEGEAYGSQTQS